MRTSRWAAVLLLILSLLVAAPARADGLSDLENNLPYTIPADCPELTGGPLVPFGCTKLSLALQDVRIKLREVQDAKGAAGNWSTNLPPAVRDALLKSGISNTSTLSIGLRTDGNLVVGFSNAKAHAEPRVLGVADGQTQWVVWDPATRTFSDLPADGYRGALKIFVEAEPCTGRKEQSCAGQLKKYATDNNANVEVTYSFEWTTQYWDAMMKEITRADPSQAPAIISALEKLDEDDRSTFIQKVTNGKLTAVKGIPNSADTGRKVQALNELIPGPQLRKYKTGSTVLNSKPRYIPAGDLMTAIGNAITILAKEKDFVDPRPAASGNGPGEDGTGGVKPGTGPKDTGPKGGGTGEGGIDFASVELRYVSASGAGSYAFGAPTTPGKTSTNGIGAVLRSFDAVQVWTTVEPSKFWVNLNPNEPDRVIDPVLGATDVGRVLLEADLRLKEAGTTVTDPNSKLGKQFWKRMEAAHLSAFCTRNWIVPGTATVHESGDDLYILDAPLKVESEGDYFSLPGSKQEICPADSSKAAALYKNMIVPALTRAVNTSPVFRDLRQVYLARVVAEWSRRRAAAAGPEDEEELGIDSNDVTNLETADDWVPKDVFDKYVKEINATTYKTKDFTVTTGGVDFSQPVTWSALDDTAFAAKYAQLPTVVRNAASAVTRTRDGNTAYVGGSLGPGPTAAPAASANPAVVPPSPDTFAAHDGNLDRHPIRSTLLVIGSLLLILLAWRITVVERKRRRGQLW